VVHRLDGLNLDPHKGSEQAGRRPIIVISRERLNQTLPILAVIPVTSYKEGRRIYPTEVLLPAGTAGLNKSSLALGHQVRTIAKERLEERLGSLTQAELSVV
jgi:mRNA interferase MazF